MVFLDEELRCLRTVSVVALITSAMLEVTHLISIIGKMRIGRRVAHRHRSGVLVVGVLADEKAFEEAEGVSLLFEHAGLAPLHGTVSACLLFRHDAIGVSVLLSHNTVCVSLLFKEHSNPSRHVRVLVFSGRGGSMRCSGRGCTRAVRRRHVGVRHTGDNRSSGSTLRGNISA